MRGIDKNVMIVWEAITPFDDAAGMRAIAGTQSVGQAVGIGYPSFLPKYNQHIYPQYTAECWLPGMKKTLGTYPNIAAAIDAVEDAVQTWFKGAGIEAAGHTTYTELTDRKADHVRV